MSLVEDHACAAIMRERGRRGLVLPRYTPRDWWECDVFELTAAGYFREYEIKLSLPDFVRDACKTRQAYREGFGHPAIIERKHELLAVADPRGPAEFYYVAPVGLIPANALPPWAGLIELSDRGPGHRPSWRWSERMAVAAPRLHYSKADPKIRADVLSCCYHRFHAAADRLRDSTRELKEWTDTPAPETDSCSAPQ